MPFSKSVNLRHKSLFLKSQFCFIYLYIYLYACTNCLDYCCFIPSSKNFEVSIFLLCSSFFKFALPLLSLLKCHMNFWVSYPFLQKKAFQVLIETALHMSIALGNIAILTMLNFPINEHGMFFYRFRSLNFQ